MTAGREELGVGAYREAAEYVSGLGDVLAGANRRRGARVPEVEDDRDDDEAGPPGVP